MDEDEVNCSVCMEPFDEDGHSPRTLRCGHTLCTFCIDALLQKLINDRLCPECRKPLKITNVSHLPVSYTVLRLSRALSDVNFKLVNEVIDDGDVCLLHGSPIIAWCKKCNDWLCRRCKCNKRCSSTMPLCDALLHLKRECVEKTTIMISSLQNKKELCEDMKHALEGEILKIKEKVDSLAEKLKKIEKGVSTIQEDEAQVVEFNSVRRIERAIRRSTTHMNELKDLIAEDSRESTPEIPLPATIDVEALKKKLEMTRSMYAVHTKVDGSTWWSRLTVHGTNMLLHASEETPPPADATLVEFHKVVNAANPFKQAFLDIEIGSRFEGRLYMVMFGRTPRSENFLRFCRGEYGPCYKGLELFPDDRYAGNLIRSGEFENKNHWKALIDGISDGGEYTRKVHPGIICGDNEDCDDLSYFEIATRYGDGCVNPCSFGKVINGLAILRCVYELKNTNKRAVIRDCGVIIPL